MFPLVVKCGGIFLYIWFELKIVIRDKRDGRSTVTHPFVLLSGYLIILRY